MGERGQQPATCIRPPPAQVGTPPRLEMKERCWAAGLCGVVVEAGRGHLSWVAAAVAMSATTGCSTGGGGRRLLSKCEQEHGGFFRGGC